MRPKQRDSTSTYSAEKSPSFIYPMPNTRHRRLAPMKVRPPMVGVPALVACQLGPTSRISCPAFSRRSMGIKIQPRVRLRAKAQRIVKMM